MSYSPPKYPAAIPNTTTDLPDQTDDIDWIEAWIYNYVKKELLAVMTELGVDPAGAEATVAARLTAIEAAGIDESVIMNIYLNSFRIAVLGSYAVMNMVKGISDEYEDETGIDTGASTNEDYDSSNDLYSPTAGARATGGTITTDGLYTIHTFLENGTFEPDSAFNIEYLVVAGGGGGAGVDGGSGGGGGGAGGLLHDSEHAMTAQEYVVVVGGGGDGGGAGVSENGDNGVDTTFVGVTAVGGGGGGKHNTVGSVGGSGGGGGGRLSTAGGAGTALQGNAGGTAADGDTSSDDAGGGGGGAGAVGADSPAGKTGGAGGVGLDYSTEFGTSVGESGYFAGGGGGGYDTGGSGGAGGTGGGGAGGANNATVNTGGGGGGGIATSGGGGAGGSGIVIIKYLSHTENMVLVSEKFVADETPDETRIIIFEEDIDAITLNTDIKAYVSRDDGANYTQITLTDEGNYSGSKRILSGTADISGQPEDTDMVYKIESLNNKDIKIHGTGLSWA